MSTATTPQNIEETVFDQHYSPKDRKFQWLAWIGQMLRLVRSGQRGRAMDFIAQMFDIDPTDPTDRKWQSKLLSHPELLAVVNRFPDRYWRKIKRQLSTSFRSRCRKLLRECGWQLR